MAYFNSRRTMLIGLKGPKGDTGDVSIEQLNSLSMKPSSNVQIFNLNIPIVTKPADPNYFLMTAPTNGVAYCRFNLSGTGAIGLHLQDENGNDKAYNTQSWDANGYHLYNATFVMKAGQQLIVYENALTFNWGQINFVKSETL